MPVSHSQKLLCVSLSGPSPLPDAHRFCRIGHVVDFVAFAAEDAQQIDLVGIALGQGLAVADARHLRAALLVIAFGAGDMGEVLRMRRIGHVDDRGAVEFGLAGQGIERLRHFRRAAMVADIGDIAVALMVDGRLIGGAVLQIVIADQPHIARFRRIADFGRAGDGDDVRLRRLRDGRQRNSGDHGSDRRSQRRAEQRD